MYSTVNMGSEKVSVTMVSDIIKHLKVHGTIRNIPVTEQKDIVNGEEEPRTTANLNLANL